MSQVKSNKKFKWAMDFNPKSVLLLFSIHLAHLGNLTCLLTNYYLFLEQEHLQLNYRLRQDTVNRQMQATQNLRKTQILIYS